MAKLVIRTKRIYEKAEKIDGLRVLVDRLWPRGVSTADARIDAWEKELAPSTKLRQWFGHDPNRWTEFQERYRTELEARHEYIRSLVATHAIITLLYSAKDESHNQATVLKAVIEKLAA